jgi:hypothetical protein
VGEEVVWRVALVPKAVRAGAAVHVGALSKGRVRDGVVEGSRVNRLQLDTSR